MATSEAQKRASKKYRLAHRDLYSKYSCAHVKKVKTERLMYMDRCEKALDKVQLIIDYGFDYDGFESPESLKGLIDMLVDYARDAKQILKGEDNGTK